MPALLVVCFAFSGVTSLVLQVVWVRRLIGVFGASSLAIATVLATFMAGLALGSKLGGIWADRLSGDDQKPLASRRKDPFFYYGLAEILVGVSAVAILPLIDAYRDTNAWLWQQLGETPWLLAVARFTLTATVLLLPTTAMGTTLPLLARRIARWKDDLGILGTRIGTLYAVNTLGAVCGAAGAGFWLIPQLGVSNTNLVAAIVAVAIGVTAVLLGGRTPPRPSDDATQLTKTKQRKGITHNLSAKERRVVIWLYATSGAVAMLLEVLWSRTLAIVNGSSVYSFTIVLCTFLVGISVGSALGGAILTKARRPLRVLAHLCLFSCLSIALFYAAADELPGLFLSLVEGTNLDVDVVVGAHILLTAVAIVPTALSFGAIMPVAMHALVREVDELGRDVGGAYAANTIGAIVGSLLGGFVVLPLVGLERGIFLAGCTMLALAIAVVLLSPGKNIATAIAGVIVLILSLLPSSWNRSNLTAGLFRTHQASEYIRGGGLFQRQVVHYRDGVSTTVSVERLGDSWVMRNNGKVEASSRHDMPTQILVGLLPVLLHGGTDQDVFLVGYGSGVTVGSIALAPMVRHVDVVELEPAVIEAADKYFGSFNNEPEKNPKVKRLIGDGRNVLLAGKRTYDVIVSEPSNPWIAGVATLFTREFYALAKEHLTPDGIFCQWAQLYELGPRNVKMIYRTFAESFRYVYAFTPGDETTDTILLGSDRPLDFHLQRLRERMNTSEVLVAELKRAEVENAEDLVASILLGPSEVQSFTAGADINTDDNVLLEYSAPHDLLASANSGYFARLVRGNRWPYGFLHGLVTGIDTLVPGEGEERLARAFMTYGRLHRARQWLDRARERKTIEPLLERVLSLAEPRDYRDPELGITQGGPVLPTPSTNLFVQATDDSVRSLTRAFEHMANGNWEAAFSSCRGLPLRADSDDGRDITLFMGFVAYKALEFDAARKLLSPLRENPDYVRRRPAVLYYLARTHFGLGHFRDAILLFEDFATRWPEMADECIRKRL